MVRSSAREFALADKFTATEDAILLSGVQAIARLPLDQRRADEARGYKTAGFISGYRGSPLAGLDTIFAGNSALHQALNIQFQPGVNEDLAATMIFGSQTADLYPNPRYAGVIGLWYGKAPGLDRSMDILKHANYAGVGRLGGALVVAGDDPLSKSSTLPSRTETAFYDALMPVLAPGNVQQVLDFGRIGFELSRYSGLWAGLKIDAHVADQFSTVTAGQLPAINTPPRLWNGQPWTPRHVHTLGSPTSLHLEQELFEARLPAAVNFARSNWLNKVTGAKSPWIGIVAAGKVYFEVIQALRNLGLDTAELDKAGIRLWQLGMVFPFDQEAARTFAHRLQEVIVVEEKRAFIETMLRDALYQMADRPEVVGKLDQAGRTLVPAFGGLDAAILMPILARCFAGRLGTERFEPYLSALQNSLSAGLLPMTTMARTPYFCSGCPHNRSTKVPAGSVAAGGIGCHGLVHGMDRDTFGLAHMGGEGAQLAGAQPFCGLDHAFQNLGDGTLFHSGSLAIRQAISAGANITYKILFNDAVGMTGGQHVDGALAVDALTRALEAEGVRKIIVTTDDPDKYPRGMRWAPGVEVWHRDRLDEAQRVLRLSKGVTVLIHDQVCAAELRRRRKRGTVVEPVTRVVINEALCEGCGDCGAKSNCLSVHPVDTEYGRKTRIHQSSCNKDYSCLLGDCPAFVTVELTGARSAPKPVLQFDEPIPAPILQAESQSLERTPGFSSHVPANDTNVYLIGVGGSGVVTVNQILGTAAMLDGKFVDGLDQTGLSQKGGAVVSHLKIGNYSNPGSNLIQPGTVDCYLAFDILTAAQAPHLARANPNRTGAIVSTSQVPTGAMVRDSRSEFPAQAGLAAIIGSRTCPSNSTFLDAAAMAEKHFGDHLAANMIVVGAAYQRGLLPITPESIERAITLNGAQVAMNISAFRLGRTFIISPQKIQQNAAKPNAHGASGAALSPALAHMIDALHAGEELRRLLMVRLPELVAYQDENYARQYIQYIQRVVLAEKLVSPTGTTLGEAVARNLFKLMAYKDEYEVSRLARDKNFAAELEAQFGPDARAYSNLHPPFLRALGLRRKIRLGRWFMPWFGLLYKLRWLRGTPLDLFGTAHVRKTERALIREYRSTLDGFLTNLTADNYSGAVSVAGLPDLVRGYEGVKMANVARFRSEINKLAGTNSS